MTERKSKVDRAIERVRKLTLEECEEFARRLSAQVPAVADMVVREHGEGTQYAGTV